MSPALVLDPDLLARREQAREAYPDREFLPGDPVPHGKVLLSNGRTGEVLGEYHPTRPEERCMRWWWRVRWDVPLPSALGGFLRESLEWPPTVRRAPP